MDHLALHNDSRNLLGLLAKRPPQALLLSGERGVGLGTIAKTIAGKQLSVLLAPTNVKGELDARSGAISVEQIRELYTQTRSKSTSEQYVIIDDADKMTLSAQGAFLKLLEEPAKHVYFILTSHHPSALLPTILSRVQQFTVGRLSIQETARFLDTLTIKDSEVRQKILFIASGLPAEIMRLHTNNDYFESQARIVSDAKALLQGTLYEKLVTVHQYQTSRDKSLTLIDATVQILKYLIRSNPTDSTIAQLDTLLIVRNNIVRMYSPRLQLLHFVL